MTEHQFKSIDPEDIEDLLFKVENSFNIRFAGNELQHIITFKQLCDHIENKIKLDRSDSCTSQQAFYKLREAIVSMARIDKRSITTDSLLADLLPRQTRRTTARKLEEYLGFKLNIVRPHCAVENIYLILLLVSLVMFFVHWQIGLSGFVIAIGGFWVGNYMGNELDLKTIGQVAEKMARENYLKSRRHPNTYNKKEVEKVLTNWFDDSFCF